MQSLKVIIDYNLGESIDGLIGNYITDISDVENELTVDKAELKEWYSEAKSYKAPLINSYKTIESKVEDAKIIISQIGK